MKGFLLWNCWLNNLRTFICRHQSANTKGLLLWYTHLWICKSTFMILHVEKAEDFYYNTHQSANIRGLLLWHFNDCKYKRTCVMINTSVRKWGLLKGYSYERTLNMMLQETFIMTCLSVREFKRIKDKGKKKIGTFITTQLAIKEEFLLWLPIVNSRKDVLWHCKWLSEDFYCDMLISQRFYDSWHCR